MSFVPLCHPYQSMLLILESLYIIVFPKLRKPQPVSGYQILINQHAQNLDVESDSSNAVSSFNSKDGVAACYHVNMKREIFNDGMLVIDSLDTFFSPHIILYWLKFMRISLT